MTISEQIIQVLDDLCRRFGVVIDWSKETVVPYLEELMTKFITFEVKTSWFWIIFTASVTVLCWILTIIFSTPSLEDWGMGCIFFVASVILTVATILVAGFQIYDIITCEAFPEKILFREIKELLESAKNY